MRVITGTARGVVLKTPEGQHTRPTSDRVKEALFSIIQFDIPNAKVLDLFGGTGQLGIEALSRGAKSAVFVDEREDACGLVKENLRRTKLTQNATVIRSDYMSYLKRCREQFDIIFLDPPYNTDLLDQALEMIATFDICRAHGIIVAESAADKVLPAMPAPYRLYREYRYGQIKLTVYHRDGNED